MSLFLPFLLVLAAAWAVVGILLARWLKQAGHNKPFKGKEWSSRDLYGGGVGFGRGSERTFGGGDAGSKGRGDCEYHLGSLLVVTDCLML